MSPDHKHPKFPCCPAGLGAQAKLFVPTIILAKRLASACGISTFAHVERAKPKSLGSILGGNAGLRDPKYRPATHGLDLYPYLPKISTPKGPCMRVEYVGRKGLNRLFI